jgi:hypothetical protein
MNPYWLNRQNKQGTKFNQADYFLTKVDLIGWYEAPLVKYNIFLNLRASKISPRQPRKVLQKIADDVGINIEEIFD